MQELELRLCKPATCPNIQLVDGRRVHSERLGGNHMHFSREKKYRIPENLIRYLCGFPDPDVMRCVADTLYQLQIRAQGHVSFEVLDDDEEANRT